MTRPALRAIQGGKRDGVARFDFVAPIYLDPKRTDGVLGKLTDQGFIRCEARIARSGILQYSDGQNTWNEYRPDEEIFGQSTLDSFQLVTVTNDHPDEMVGPKNVRDVAVGHIGSNIRRDGQFLVADLMIWHPDAIAAVKDGKHELSIGFTCDVEPQTGKTDAGERYDAIQRNLRGNHVAIVDRGRAGPEVKLLLDRYDGGAIHNPTPRNDNMGTETINIGGVEIQVQPEVAAHLAALEKENGELKTKLAKTQESEPAVPDAKTEPAPVAAPQAGTPAPAAAQPQPKGDAAELVALKAKCDALEARLANEHERFDARATIREAAREVFGPEVKLDGLTNEQIMGAVVAEVLPQLASKLDSAKPGYLEAVFAQALDAHRSDSATETVIVPASATYQADDLSQLRDRRIARQARLEA